MNVKRNEHWFVTLTLLFILLVSTSPLLAAGETEKTLVEATGSAPLTDGRGLAKELALKDAFRAAVEQALGVRIIASTAMENLTITSDVVTSQTWGHILSYRIVKETEAQGNLYVTITAEVSSDTRWWADFTGVLDIVRFHIKDLVLKKTIETPGEVLSGAIFFNQTLVVPFKTDDYRIAAIHTESHQIMWKRDLPGKPVLPLITDGNWIVAVTSDKIVTFNPQYGWVKWTYKLDETVYQTPVIVGDTMYVTTKSGRFLAIGMKIGNLLWQYASQSYFPSAPVVAGGRAYFLDGKGYLHALDLARQSRTFKQLINLKAKATPTVTPIYTYLGWNDASDKIIALNSTNGSTAWSFEGKVSPSATTALSPYLAQGKLLGVFTQSNESRLYLFDALNGRLIWDKTLKMTISEVTAMGNGVIVLNTWEGPRILDLEHGNLLWETAGSGLKAQLISGEDQLLYLHNKVVDIFQ